MAREKSENTAESSGIIVKILESIQKHRKSIFIGLIVIAVAVIGAIVFVSVRESLHESALVRVDGFERRFMELQSPEVFAASEVDHIIRMIDLNALLAELSDFQKRAFGFASARAHVLTGDIYWEMGELSFAENAWLEAARAAKNSYLEPVSYFNAAAAAEERGNIDSAIAHYERVLAVGENFPAAARAQFAIGRLEESRNNITAAISAYETVLRRWHFDTAWANLAQSRILALSN